MVDAACRVSNSGVQQWTSAAKAWWYFAIDCSAEAVPLPKLSG